jgi:hypothetical protein
VLLSPTEAALDHDFIASIYEAAVVPELWKGRGLLDQLARRSYAHDAVLMSVSPDRDFRWIGNDSAIPKMHVYIEEGWGAKNPVPAE